MNALIYTEDSKLIVRKENGLQYDFENVDRPELGFDFDVLVYDDVEVKILKWEDGKQFDEQEHTALTEEDKLSIETYIKNSEPPLGYNLNQQYINQLERLVLDYQTQCSEIYGMYDLLYATAAGREGSNHPRRSDARRALEYFDNIWFCFENVVEEIRQTREDTLKDFSHYAGAIPDPLVTPDSRSNR